MLLQGLAAIILAAGKSTRMENQNKLLLPWKGKTIIHHVVKNILAAEPEESVLVLGHQHKEVQTSVAGLNVKFTIYNNDFETGMASSIRSGISTAPPTVKGYLFMLGDMPEVKSETIRKLGEALCQSYDTNIICPTFQGKRGNPTIIGSAYREELLQLEGDQGAKPIVQNNPNKVIEVAVDDPGIFKDVDTEDTYKELKG